MIALATDMPLVSVSYLEFLGHMLPVTIATMCLTWYLKIHGWLRPASSPVLSWEMALFQIIRWPWALYGTVMGVSAAIRKKQVPFRVTPKGAIPEAGLEPKLMVPYVIILLLSLGISQAFSGSLQAHGYHYFLILNGVVYSLAIGLILFLQNRERKHFINPQS